MPISFPTSPSVGNTYTVGTKTWSWNGYAWDLQSTSIAPAFNTANAAFDKANSTTYTSNVVISVTDNTNAALRITQTGTADVIRIEDETNPDANVFVIDSAGRVIVGNTVSRVSYDNQQGMLQITNGYGVFPTHIALFSNNTVSSQRTSLRFHKSRPSGPNLTSSSIIGSIEFVGHGNSLYEIGAAIYAQTGSGLIDDTSMPCALVFQTTANGQSFPSTRMTIDPTGNVGIGTTSPTSNLHVIGAANVSQKISVGKQNLSGSTLTSSDAAKLLIDSSTYTDANSAPNATAAFSSTVTIWDTTFASVNSNVTITNAASLYVRAAPVAGSNTTITDTWGAYLNGKTYLSNDLVTSGAIYFVATGGPQGAKSTYIDSISADTIQIYTASTERMRVDSNGRILIGSANSVSTSTAALQVSGNGNSSSISLVKNDITSSGGSTGGIDSWAYDNSSYFVGGTINFRAAENWSSTNHGTSIQFRVTPTGSGGTLYEAMRIDASGNVGIGTATPNTKLEVIGSVNATDFNSTSDIKLKYNINTLNNSIDVITQINPVSFNWKENDKKSYGVIAQEIESILPEIVSGTDTKHVSYIQLIAFLIGAVKELNEKVEDLKNNCLVSKKGIEDGKV